MPPNTREKQLAKLAAKRQAERRAKERRQRLLTIAIALLVALSGIGFAFFAIRGGGDETADPGSTPSPTPAATPTPTPTETPDESPSPSGPVACEGDVPEGAEGAAEREAMYDKAPEMQIDPEKTYTATIETSCGTMTAELFAKDAPKTVNSFVFLAKEGFFDGLIFHRVIKDFVIQGGDPTGTGSGGPGYQFEDELNNGHTYEIGTLAMANSGPNTNGSQFFVIIGPQGVALPNQYSIFGKVNEGVEAALEIGNLQTEADRPVETAYIEKVTIAES